jgi:hypothetical protein
MLTDFKLEVNNVKLASFFSSVGDLKHLFCMDNSLNYDEKQAACGA